MSKKNQNTLLRVLDLCRPVFWMVFAFAFGVNLLMLVTPLYSLQVLDRVLSSQNLNTLLMLSLLMVGLYGALHLLQVARSFTLIKLGEWMDRQLSPDLFANSIRSAALKASVGGAQNLRDLQTVKTFLTSVGINTLFDAPWSIIYIIVLFIIHSWMGWLSVIGALLLSVCAYFNARSTTAKLNEANEESMRSMNQSELATRNAEVIEAMGMMKAVTNVWQKYQQNSLELISVASYRNGIISNFSKFVRAILQMLVTAIGAYLVVTQPMHMSMGGMIGSSIIMGRALVPFDNAIEIWKQISGAMKAYERLKNAYVKLSDRQESMKLPTPEGKIDVENIFFAPTIPGATGPVPYTLKGVSFSLNPGEILAIIGPSAAGKSSLARILVGVWKALQGTVRLDGADVYTWNRDDFGNHVGYLPQNVELFSGSIKHNIARLRDDVNPEDIVEAAKMTGAHDLILRLKNGYESDIGVGGSNLSGGQKQRVGLARAFFGNPKFVVLDEPNANLDELGEQALVSALMNAKQKKITTIVISHRPSILSCVDKILILQDGSVAAFGTREEIMSKFGKPTSTPSQPKVEN
ncbi:MAG: type I secretion system permease/ATPase [Rickettsiales bacterium]